MSFLAQCLLAVAIVTYVSAFQPIVHSRAGVFHGRELPEFDQDVFLGIKYAPEPIRFTPSQLARNAPHENFNVTQYGVDCQGYGIDTTLLVKEGWTTLGEDCLHLNIIKPRINRTDLPVLVWVYGGGWQQGSTSDPRCVSESLD